MKEKENNQKIRCLSMFNQALVYTCSAFHGQTHLSHMPWLTTHCVERVLVSLVYCVHLHLLNNNSGKKNLSHTHTPSPGTAPTHPCRGRGCRQELETGAGRRRSSSRVQRKQAVCRRYDAPHTAAFLFLYYSFHSKREVGESSGRAETSAKATKRTNDTNDTPLPILTTIISAANMGI